MPQTMTQGSLASGALAAYQQQQRQQTPQYGLWGTNQPPTQGTYAMPSTARIPAAGAGVSGGQERFIPGTPAQQGTPVPANTNPNQTRFIPETPGPPTGAVPGQPYDYPAPLQPGTLGGGTPPYGTPQNSQEWYQNLLFNNRSGVPPTAENNYGFPSYPGEDVLSGARAQPGSAGTAQPRSTNSYDQQREALPDILRRQGEEITQRQQTEENKAQFLADNPLRAVDPDRIPQISGSAPGVQATDEYSAMVNYRLPTPVDNRSAEQKAYDQSWAAEENAKRANNAPGTITPKIGSNKLPDGSYRPFEWWREMGYASNPDIPQQQQQQTLSADRAAFLNRTEQQPAGSQPRQPEAKDSYGNVIGTEPLIGGKPPAPPAKGSTPATGTTNQFGSTQTFNNPEADGASRVPSTAQPQGTTGHWQELVNPPPQQNYTGGTGAPQYGGYTLVTDPNTGQVTIVGGGSVGSHNDPGYIDPATNLIQNPYGLDTDIRRGLPGGDSGGSTGGTGGTGTGLAIPEMYQNAYEEAKRANEQRYQDIKGDQVTDYGKLYDDTMQWQQDSAGNLIDMYGERYGRNMQRLEGYGEQENKDIADRFKQLRASEEQNLINRGMGNTTIRTPAMASIGRAESDALGAAKDRQALLQLQADTGLSGEQLNAAMALQGQSLGVRTDLPQRQLDFMERRTDAYPDLNQLLALAGQYGNNLGNLIGGNQGGTTTVPFYQPPYVPPNIPGGSTPGNNDPYNLYTPLVNVGGLSGPGGLINPGIVGGTPGTPGTSGPGGSLGGTPTSPTSPSELGTPGTGEVPLTPRTPGGPGTTPEPGDTEPGAEPGTGHMSDSIDQSLFGDPNETSQEDVQKIKDEFDGLTPEQRRKVLELWAYWDLLRPGIAPSPRPRSIKPLIDQIKMSG